jgi:hypothetical protein
VILSKEIPLNRLTDCELSINLKTVINSHKWQANFFSDKNRLISRDIWGYYSELLSKILHLEYDDITLFRNVGKYR